MDGVQNIFACDPYYDMIKSTLRSEVNTIWASST